MKISLVIPVYNEATTLHACLNSIANQEEMPDEVIVVDNNSSDATVSIAESFPFVTLLREPKQGVVHARNLGFDTAIGDIIGRIDADTLLPPDWTIKVKAIFKADQALAAVSGSAHYYDFALSNIADEIDMYLRGHLAYKLRDNLFLWGANMAVKRSAWQAVRPRLCIKGAIHEDFDLAIHMQELGMKVGYDQTLNAGVSSRRIDSGLLDYMRYTLRNPHTYAVHRIRSRYHIYPVIMVCWLVYLPARFIYRGCDPVTGEFSFSKLLTRTTEARVDPTANVI